MRGEKSRIHLYTCRMTIIIIVFLCPVETRKPRTISNHIPKRPSSKYAGDVNFCGWRIVFEHGDETLGSTEGDALLE